MSDVKVYSPNEIANMWTMGSTMPTGFISKSDYDSAQKKIEAQGFEIKMLVETGARLLERIDHNGGIGEYNGGPAFVVEPFRKALSAILNTQEGL